MNVVCRTHRQPDPGCTACGIAELSKMTRPASGRAEECRVCLQPADPDNPAGLCGADDHDHRVGWTTAQTRQPWPGNAT